MLLAVTINIKYNNIYVIRSNTTALVGIMEAGHCWLLLCVISLSKFAAEAAAASVVEGQVVHPLHSRLPICQIMTIYICYTALVGIMKMGYCWLLLCIIS